MDQDIGIDQDIELDDDEKPRVVNPTQAPKLIEPQLVDISLIDDNPYSANEQDTATFEKLQENIKKFGLVEIPVLKRKPDGRYSVLSGKHRKDAFSSLGGSKIYAVVLDTPLDPEEEFNTVNNFNLIKGDMRKNKLVRIVKENNLDPTKIDLFKLPQKMLFPAVEIEDIKKAQDEAKRAARVNQLALEISKLLAPIVYEEKDELVSFIIVKDTPIALLRIPVKEKKKARAFADVIEKGITDLLHKIFNIREPEEEGAAKLRKELSDILKPVDQGEPAIQTNSGEA